MLKQYKFNQTASMDLYEGYKLNAVKERLALAVAAIAERHRTAGRVLTWRLVHEIEREALKTLERAGDLDRKYIRMVRSSRWGYVPRVNQVADLDNHDILPVALTYIRKVYYSYH
jgi:hypothetical protein